MNRSLVVYVDLVWPEYQWSICQYKFEITNYLSVDFRNFYAYQTKIKILKGWEKHLLICFQPQHVLLNLFLTRSWIPKNLIVLIRLDIKIQKVVQSLWVSFLTYRNFKLPITKLMHDVLLWTLSFKTTWVSMVYLISAIHQLIL